jgi:ribbon-helix-helix CopG family protein
MTLERLEVLLDPATMAELRRDAAARGVSPPELAREAIEAFIDVERAVILEPEELADDDELDVDGEMLEDADEDWADLERQIVSLAESDDD